jgi:signal transduction protein with GAF and PtsI domain
MGLQFNSIPIRKSQKPVTQRRDKAMSELVAERSTDLTALERKQLQQLANSNLECSDLAEAMLVVLDE